MLIIICLLITWTCDTRKLAKHKKIKTTKNNLIAEFYRYLKEWQNVRIVMFKVMKSCENIKFHCRKF